jgi:CheY-like chemotaxis protein
LLAFGRRHEKQTQSLDLNEVINNLAKMLRRLIGEDITLKTVYGNNLQPIAGDVSMIEQIILNLAVNARDAMPKGGTLTITTEAVTVNAAHAARHRGAKAGEFVSLRVCDTGTGMTPDVLAHISEPFFTTKGVGKGTGLGLANVYGIVQKHSGWVEVHSQVDAGTEFTVCFPRAQEPVGKSATAPVPMPTSGGRETILIVEDDELVSRMTAQILKQNGYQVFEADSGVAALEFWKQKSSQIDVVLADMILPGGMSGRDLAEQLVKTKPDLKIIYTSGYSPERANQDATPVKNLKFIPKPYTPDSLLQAIRSCLTDAAESRTEGSPQKNAQ